MRKAIGRLMAGLLLVCGITATAQNPIITGQFTADPTARVFNGRMYVYPSHDIRHPHDKSNTWFCMPDYHVFSSDNLTDWTDHGVILDQENVEWVNSKTYSMWAPDCVEKDGTYYFYFPAIGRDDVHRGYGVGVATSKHPAGPFTPMARPIEGIGGIDPCVFIDKDGESYIYWSGSAGQGLTMARLNSDMTSLKTKPEVIAGLPNGFKEGPFVFERQGKYYLTFPWVRKNVEALAYAMGPTPEGPWDFKGVIMDESPVNCWTNHHSIVEYEGQWYLFYHHNDYSPEFDKNRSSRIDSLFFNADGTIQKVNPTLRGVGITDARSIIQIDRYSTIDKAGIEFIDTKNKFEGWKLVMKEGGAAATYNRVDFGETCPQKVWLRVRTENGGKLTLSIDGKVAAKAKVKKGGEWQTVGASVKGKWNGVHNLTISLLEGDVEIDWVTFADHSPLTPWNDGAFQSGRYRNLFVEAGYSPKAVEKKLQEVFDGVFYGPDKVYFEVGDSMAYMSDLKNHDVRTEGMSYGMMIAVQLDKKEIFDRLWRWGKKYMQHQDGPLKGYFAWSCKTDGTRNSQGPASDGELYYVTALIFASNRWGNDTGINYLAEAQNILNCAMEKPDEGHATPFINRQRKLINFVPSSWGNRFTDPSYHVPAFYEVWARWANDGRADYWRGCAEESREYLHRSVHPATGLTPDYNNYDGTLLGSDAIIGDAFRFDSWRVPMNIAMDYSWQCVDKTWQQNYANKIQSFFYNQGLETFVDQFNVDGTTPSRILDAGGKTKLRHSVGLVATLAAASLASSHGRNIEFIHHLWESKHEPYDDGYFDAYYDGLLRLFAFMHLSGNYRIIAPAN